MCQNIFIQNNHRQITILNRLHYLDIMIVTKDSVTSCCNRSLPIDWDSVKAVPAGAKEILHNMLTAFIFMKQCWIFAINTTSLEMHLIRLDLQSALMYDSLMVFSYGVCYVLHHILPGYQPYIFYVLHHIFPGYQPYIFHVLHHHIFPGYRPIFI